MTKRGLELRPADSYLRQVILSLCLVSTTYRIPQVWFLSVVFLWMGHNFLFLCMPCNFFFLLKTGQFEYYSLITLEIRFSSFLRVCCCCLLRDTIYLVTFPNIFFSAETAFLAMCNHGNLHSIMSLVSQ